MSLQLRIPKSDKSYDSENLADFRLHEQLNMLKIFKEDLYTFPDLSLDQQNYTYDVEHDLGYKPQYFSFFRFPGTDNWYPVSSIVSPTEGEKYNLGVWRAADEQAVTITAQAGAPFPPDPELEVPSPNSLTVKTFVCADPLQDAWYESAVGGAAGGDLPSELVARIARPGVNALTAQYRDCVWDYELPTFLFHRVVKFDASDRNSEFELIEHGLNYPCFAWGFSESEGNYSSINSSLFSPDIVITDTHIGYKRDTEAYIILALNPLDE